MLNTKSKLTTYLLIITTALIFSITTLAISATDKKFMPTVTPSIFSKALVNKNWKQAFITGESAQIVLMNVSASTNPKNEVGKENHKFDQVVVVISGNGKAILNGKIMEVKGGDMIFIPKGTEHNIINSNQERSLKIISVYSDNDIPMNAVYPTKADEPKQ